MQNWRARCGESAYKSKLQQQIRYSRLEVVTIAKYVEFSG